MNSTYTIIEDCSPYYIRFTHDGIKEFVDYSLDVYNQQDWSNVNSGVIHPDFKHCKVSDELGLDILARTPVSKNIELNHKRVSFFHSSPGLYYRAHKDGWDHRFSINYAVKVLDDKCITNWYGDELKSYPLDSALITHATKSRECLNFDKTKHVPLKSMTAKTYECVLFNTDIFHSWDNTESTNERIVLTFRSVNTGGVYFEDARKLIFG